MLKSGARQTASVETKGNIVLPLTGNTVFLQMFFKILLQTELSFLFVLFLNYVGICFISLFEMFEIFMMLIVLQYFDYMFIMSVLFNHLISNCFKLF